MIQKLFLASVGFTSLALVLAFGLMGHWLIALVILLAELLWWFGWRRKLAFISYVYLFINLGFCVLGTWIELQHFWLLAAVIATLTAWDLDRFDQWLNHIGRVDMKAELNKRHLLRLLLVDSLGLVTGGAALVVRVQLDFVWILILALLTVIGLSQFYNLIKREIEKR